MSTPNLADADAAIDAFISDHAPEIVETTRALLRIPSVKDTPASGAPFGQAARDALDFVLEQAEKHGLPTRNLSGYAGHAEWRGPDVGADAALVGVLAHVDVVPAGADWSVPPFAAEIVDGAIVARGAIDDKGPCMAGLWAILAAQASGARVTKRVRLIVGADEESNWECMARYFAEEEMPDTGFTPDAMFPLVYAEKGIANATVTRSAPPEGERIHVVSLHGGLRPNVVPDTAEAVLRDLSPFEAMRARLNAVVGITTHTGAGDADGSFLRVVARGVSAHGSTPEQGVNAVATLCDALLLLDHREDQVEVIQQMCVWAEDTTGKELGIAGADDAAGPLTCNLGMADYADDVVTLVFNIRYPVSWDAARLRGLLETRLADTPWTLAELSHQAPLYVAPDDPLVQTLLGVYRAETGDQSAPLTMGGGTYARALTKGVAFGASFPSATTPGPHEVNEAWAVSDLLQATRIYAKALVRLAQ